MRKHGVFLVLILIVSLFCMKALFHPGLFTAHDIWHQVARLYWYQESIKDGVFPPRWIAPMAGGFGYPLFVFSYHFPWMIGTPLLLLGLSIAGTIKTLFVLSFLMSGWGMYWCAFLFTKSRIASTVSALLYLVAPWRFVTIFVSAAMGRAFVFTLFPFIIVSAYYVGRNKRSFFPVLAFAVAMSALILTHLISILTVTAILVPFLVYIKPSVRRIAFSAVISSILAGWYLIPLLSFSKTIQASGGQFKSLYTTQFIDFKQLIYSPWGYGIVQNTAKERAFSYQLGIAQWLVLIASFLFLLKNKQKKLSTMLLLSFSLCIYMMLDASQPLWRAASHFATFDYPTMFLMPAVFICAFLSALLIGQMKSGRIVVGAMLVIIALVNNRNYMRVNQYLNPSVSDVVAAEVTTNSFNEYLPITANGNLIGQNIPDVADTNGGIPSQTVRSATVFDSSFFLTADQTVTLKVFAFPHLKVTSGGKETSYEVSSTGQVVLSLPKGNQDIRVFYSDK